MTNLVESPSFDDIRQLETTDLALAGSGPGQIMNLQAQAFLNRWAYLASAAGASKVGNSAIGPIPAGTLLEQLPQLLALARTGNAVDTVAQLKALPIPLVESPYQPTVWLTGNAGAGVAQIYMWEPASAATPDDVYTILSNNSATGRWIAFENPTFRLPLSLSGSVNGVLTAFDAVNSNTGISAVTSIQASAAAGAAASSMGAVSGNVTDPAILAAYGPADSGFLRSGANSAGGLSVISGSVAGSIRFRTNAVERMLLLSTGYMKLSNDGTFGGVAGVGDQSTSTAHTIQSAANFPVIQNFSSNVGSGVVNYQSFLPTGAAGKHIESRLNNVNVFYVAADGQTIIGEVPAGVTDRLAFSDTIATAYTTTSAGAASPAGTTLRIGNESATNGVYAGLSFAPKNSSATSLAYIGAISAAGSNPAALVFGQRTGATAYTERMRMDTAGALLVGRSTSQANGGVVQVSDGISFPATQVARTDPNTLDDYEEGTFTPSVAGATTPGTATYSLRTGSYTKVGRLVTCQIAMTYTGGTGAGNLNITGLPFTIGGANAPCAPCAVYGGPTFTGSVHALGVSTFLEVRTSNSGSGVTYVTYTAAGSLVLTVSYEV